MWCALEINLQIIGGNIPALKPFVQRLFPRLLGSTRSRDTNGHIRLDPLTTSGHSGQGSAFGRSLHKRTTLGRITADNGSDEHIRGGSGIYKTVEVGVTFTDNPNTS